VDRKVVFHMSRRDVHQGSHAERAALELGAAHPFVLFDPRQFARVAAGAVRRWCWVGRETRPQRRRRRASAPEAITRDAASNVATS
jgi:hypothetical protein